MGYSLELIIRYIQTLPPQDAKVIQSYAAARLTALSQSADGTATNYGRNTGTIFSDGCVHNVKLAIDQMTVSAGLADLKAIEATARQLSSLDTDESSSSSSSLSSQSSSSLSSLSSSSSSSSSQSA